MASVASVPYREQSLQTVTLSLLPQVDRLNVYLNGYERVPEFLLHPRIVVARSQEYGDLGDAGKFFWLDEPAEYFLACDDDIRYPPDYLRRAVNKIEEYGRKAVIGWQGSIISAGFRDYYTQGDREILSFYREVRHDTAVHVIGTGALAFHRSAIRLSLSDFKTPNMADIWFGLQAQRQRVPLIVCAHPKGDLLPVENTQDYAIWKACVEDSGGSLNTRALQNETILGNRPWHVQQYPARASRIRYHLGALVRRLAATTGKSDA